jgi:hypothetical protein
MNAEYKVVFIFYSFSEFHLLPEFKYRVESIMCPNFCIVWVVMNNALILPTPEFSYYLGDMT